MTDIKQASREAVEAALQGEKYAEFLTMAAAIKAVQQMQSVQQPAPLPVQQQSSQVGKWIGISIGVSIFLMVAALFAVAVAVAAVSVAIASLVLWRIYKDMFATKK